MPTARDDYDSLHHLAGRLTPSQEERSRVRLVPEAHLTPATGPEGDVVVELAAADRMSPCFR